MPRTSWHLDRRTFLRGAGLSLALPWLEAMSHAAPAAQRPKRFCAFFFGNGVALPGKNQAHFQDWHWFPHTDGTDYKLYSDWGWSGPRGPALDRSGHVGVDEVFLEEGFHLHGRLGGRAGSGTVEEATRAYAG